MNLRTKIYRYLREQSTPVPLAAVKAGIDESPQAIQWQLKYLVCAGVVVKENYRYFLQPFLKDLDLTDEIYHALATSLNKRGIVFKKELEQGTNELILEGLAVILDDVLWEAAETLRSK